MVFPILAVWKMNTSLWLCWERQGQLAKGWLLSKAYKVKKISVNFSLHFDVKYIYGFVWWGSASKVDDVKACLSRQKIADKCYYGNVMITTRWWLCVSMETLWQQRCLNIQMTLALSRMLLALFIHKILFLTNLKQIRCILHLQQ